MRDFPEKLMNHLHFLGHVETEMLERYYRCCDLFVAPSLYESFGFIYIEAMSFAKPVIGCSVGGVPEVIRDGVNGKLVPPEDPAALPWRCYGFFGMNRSEERWADRLERESKQTLQESEW